jgi:hypothetical protein
MQQDLLTKPQQVAKIGEHIGIDAAEKMIKTYFDKNPDEQKYFIVGREIIEKILNQPSCVGLTVTPAIDENGSTTLVLTGIDEHRNPILRYHEIDINGNFIESEAIVADRIGNDDAPKRLSTGWLD